MAHTSGYIQAAALLLAVGLFASTHSIALADAREHWRLVLAAVTLGVMLKATLIAGVLLLAYHRPEYLVLGIAVAQIDPLSVATQAGGKRISPAARTILYAWASFDDPVTVLLTVYLSAIALGGGGVSVGGELGAFGWSLIPNLAVAAVAALWAWRRRPAWRAATAAPDAARVAGDVADLAFLALMLVVAAHFGLLLGVAVAGLYLRPAAVGSLDRVTRVAFYLAATMLGLVLVHGVALATGVLLGVTAFLAQVVAGLLLAYRLPWRDRRYLMLAQQNGITAIVLALILEPDFPGTVAIIAPAVLVINMLNAATNTWFEDGPAAIFAFVTPLRARLAAYRLSSLTPPTAPPASRVAPVRPARRAVPADPSHG